MPLIQSKSKKAVSKNIEKEMDAGKPHKQAIAIALSVQRKNKKKMAQGGRIDADSRDEAELGMVEGKSLSHGEELRAASGRPSADSKEKRIQAMLRGPLEHAPESKMAEERPSIDSQRRKRSLGMLDGESTSHEAEVSFKDGGRVRIDASPSKREMSMIAGKPKKHAPELKAAESRPTADDEDDMEMDMLKFAEGGSVADKIRAKKMYAEGGEVDLQDSNGDEHLNEEDQLSFDAARKKTYYDISQLSDQPEDSNEDDVELSDEDEHGEDMISAIRRKMKKKMV